MVSVVRAAIYIRLSQETEHTTSPAKQEEICRRYAEDRGWHVVGIYPDIDVSASHARLDRPELTKLREHCQAKAIDVVIVWRLDRLARSVLDTLVLLNEWSTVGVATASATENIDLTTPIGRAMVTLIAIFAEMEADAIKERQRGSIDQLRRNGRVPGGAVSYGHLPAPRAGREGCDRGRPWPVALAKCSRTPDERSPRRPPDTPRAANPRPGQWPPGGRMAAHHRRRAPRSCPGHPGAEQPRPTREAGPEGSAAVGTGAVRRVQVEDVRGQFQRPALLRLHVPAERGELPEPPRIRRGRRAVRDDPGHRDDRRAPPLRARRGRQPRGHG